MTVVAFVYAILAAITTWAIIGARGHWYLKAAIIVAAPLAAFAIWQTTRPITGWPANTQPPKQSQFDWAVVREPAATDSGEIDVWLTPPGAQQPRAYKLPYTRRLHRQIVAAMALTTHNVPVQAKRGESHGPRGQPVGQWVFYPSPPRGLPPKPR